MLTPDQLIAIDRHLRKENWLLNEDLIAELTDHYIAGLDDRMAAGMTFDAALRAVHTDFGGRKGLLKMEEEYQVQKFRRIGLSEWQMVHSFIKGPRWPITVALFGCLYTLNIHSGQAELIRTALGAGSIFVTFSVLGSVVQTLLFFYQNRREVNVAVMKPASPVFIGAYCLSLLLILLNKYWSDLPTPWMIGIDTLLETLCIVYYTAILICLRKTLTSNRNPKTT